jgi:16S rRNA C967 or C1407 C5-methylase (RsmB/RsmF family)
MDIDQEVAIDRANDRMEELEAEVERLRTENEHLKEDAHEENKMARQAIMFENVAL